MTDFTALIQQQALRLIPLLIACLSFPQTSFAAVKFVSASGVSRYDTLSDTQVTIFGGIAGGDTDGDCANKTGAATCNSCNSSTSASPTGCNFARIYTTLNLQISFALDDYEGQGYPAISINNQVFNNTPATTTYTKNQVATISVPWTTICGALSGNPDSTCSSYSYDTSVAVGLGKTVGTIDSTRLSVTIKVVPSSMGATTDSVALDCTTAASTANHGACDFEIFPGDEKAYILEVRVPSFFPAGDNAIQFRKIRYYYSNTLSDLVPNFKTYKDMELNNPSPGNSTASFKTSYIDSLENGRLYYFMAASVDEAENVGYFINYSSNDPNKHQVRPDKVYGLLTDKFKCFVATAAYGSPFAAKVQTFRDFRDKFLAEHMLGRKFVRWYYHNSPPWAEKIENSDYTRAAVRIALWPLWAFAEVSLRYGLFWGVSIILFVLLLCVATLRATLQKPRGRH